VTGTSGLLAGVMIVDSGGTASATAVRSSGFFIESGGIDTGTDISSTFPLV